MLRRIMPLIAFVALMICGNTRATIFTYDINITTTQEVPAPNTSGRPTPSGTGHFVLDTSIPTLTFNATVNDIDFTGTQTPGTTADNLTNAHIHSGTNDPNTASNSVAYGFFNPNSDTNGDVVITPFASGVGGTISAKWDPTEGQSVALNLNNQLANVLAAKAYINFHTTGNGSGEIRGIIPEPSMALLSTLAIFGLGLRRRSRRS